MPTYSVTILQYDPTYPGFRHWAFQDGLWPPERLQALHVTWRGTVTAPAVAAALRAIWTGLNADDRPTVHTGYSLSVGDVIICGDQAYAVAAAGFDPLPPEEAAALDARL